MPDSAAAPDPTCRPEPLLVMRGIVKQFPGVRALDGVDLDLRAGEVHCLLGQNEPARLANPTAAMRAGIATICQELDLVDGLSVAENISLGHEPSAFGFTRRGAVNRATRALLSPLGRAPSTEIGPGAEVGRLSPAGSQAVSMARALSHDARLIVMDEPSAALAHDPELS